MVCDPHHLMCQAGRLQVFPREGRTVDARVPAHVGTELRADIPAIVRDLQGCEISTHTLSLGARNARTWFAVTDDAGNLRNDEEPSDDVQHAKPHASRPQHLIRLK